MLIYLFDKMGIPQIDTSNIIECEHMTLYVKGLLIGNVYYYICSWTIFLYYDIEKNMYTLRKDFVILQLYLWLFSSTKHCIWNMV